MSSGVLSQEACTAAPVENQRWGGFFFFPERRMLRQHLEREGEGREGRVFSRSPISISSSLFFSRNSVGFCWRGGKGGHFSAQRSIWLFLLLLHTGLIWLGLYASWCDSLACSSRPGREFHCFSTASRALRTSHTAMSYSENS